MLPHSEEVEMKNRVIVALLLAVVLALPAFAQQTTTTTPMSPPSMTEKSMTVNPGMYPA